MGARGHHQLVDRFFRRPLVSATVKLTQERQGLSDGRQPVGHGWIPVGPGAAVGVQPAEAPPPFQQLFVADGEERPLQGSVDR